MEGEGQGLCTPSCFPLPSVHPHPVQRQQVVLTEQWARAHPAIHFSCMHPGWVDTPGRSLSSLLPMFHLKISGRPQDRISPGMT